MDTFMNFMIVILNSMSYSQYSLVAYSSFIFSFDEWKYWLSNTKCSALKTYFQVTLYRLIRFAYIKKTYVFITFWERLGVKSLLEEKYNWGCSLNLPELITITPLPSLPDSHCHIMKAHSYWSSAMPDYLLPLSHTRW